MASRSALARGPRASPSGGAKGRVQGAGAGVAALGADHLQAGASRGVPGQNLMKRLAPLGRQWDLEVLANLPAGTEHPGDLIEAINAQATDGRRIGWKS